MSVGGYKWPKKNKNLTSSYQVGTKRKKEKLETMFRNFSEKKGNFRCGFKI